MLVQYFRTKPYASDPSSLPKYQPNKEIDAKFREESRRWAENFTWEKYDMVPISYDL